MGISACAHSSTHRMARSSGAWSARPTRTGSTSICCGYPTNYAVEATGIAS
jgi:hypothetical protein